MKPKGIIDDIGCYFGGCSKIVIAFFSSCYKEEVGGKMVASALGISSYEVDVGDKVADALCTSGFKEDGGGKVVAGDIGISGPKDKGGKVADVDP